MADSRGTFDNGIALVPVGAGEATFNVDRAGNVYLAGNLRIGGNLDFSDGSENVELEDYLAVADGVLTQAASTQVSSAVLTASGFTVRDVGKSFTVTGADTGSACLTGRFTAYLSPTQMTMSTPAVLAVSNACAFWGTDNTAAIDRACAGNRNLVAQSGIYCTQYIRFREGQKLIGAGINNTKFVQIGSGSSAFASMLTGQVADHMHLSDFSLFCNAIGLNGNGLDLGTEIPGTTDFAFGSVAENIHIYAASGVGFRVRANIGVARNIWVSNFPSTGMPDTLSAPNTQAFNIDGSLEGECLSGEGRYELDVMSVPGNFSALKRVQFQLTGSYGTKDVITTSGNANRFADVLAINYGSVTASRRDILRIQSGAQYAYIQNLAVQSSGGGTMSFTNSLNDVNQTKSTASPLVGAYNSTDTGNLVPYDFAFPQVAGTYTPTLTGVVNITTTVASVCQYARAGSFVQVSGIFGATVVTTGGTNLAISLPVASDLAAISNCAGVISMTDVQESGSIIADTVNNRALAQWVAVTTGAKLWSFNFGYTVI